MQAPRDENFVPAMLFVGSDGETYPVEGDEATGRLFVDVAGGSGTVTSVSVVSANGLAGTVATATTTPAITLSTTITGILKGNGTAISAVTVGSGLSFDGTTLSATGGGTGTVTSVSFTGGLISVADPTTTPALTVAGTSGGIPYFSSASTWATSAALAANALVVGGGAGVAPSTITTGTGVVTALGVNVGSTGAFVTFDGALGTPSSGTVTNLTGTASININGTVGATTPTTATFTTVTVNTSANPDANDGATLGSGTVSWSDLFLALGGVISWDNSDVFITHSANALTFSGGSYLFSGSVTPAANDGSALGTSSVSWSDLFLAEGAVINWDNGDATLTQTGNVVALAGADLRVATADVGTNADSVPTLSSTSTLTNKTLTSPTINTATIGGATLLAEGASIDLDPTLSADGTYSGIAITGTAGTTLAFGDLIYLAAADSRWELVDADSVTTCGAVLTGMCVLAAAADGNATKILLKGNIRADAAFPALTIGANVYAGLTPGDIVTTAPSATDDVVHVVGKALTADSIYFDPSEDYVTIV
jgi:hypothetical protein